MKKKLLLFLALWGLLLPVTHALTLLEIRTEVRLLIKDASTTRQRYTDAQINSFINEGQRDVVNNTWCINKLTTIPLVAGTTFYSFPVDLLAVQRVTREGRNLPETTLLKLDADFSNGAWQSNGGIPQSYYQEAGISGDSLHKLGFYPWPNSVSSTGTVVLFYYALPTDMSSDSDTPFNAQYRFLSYSDLLSYFASYRIYLLEGENDKATVYRQEYESRLQVMNQRVGSRPNYNPSVSGGPGGR